MLIALFAACRSTTPPSDSGLSPPTVASAACTLAPDNALRATCTVELTAPDTVEVSLSDGEHRALFVDDAVALRHTVPLWGMTPETAWSWEVRTAEITTSGSFETGSLPPELTMNLAPFGASPLPAPMFLAPLACDDEAWAVVLDLDGRVWWYQDLQREPTEALVIKSLMWGDDDQVLALVGPRQVASFDLAGTNTMRAPSPLPTHHDVFRLDGVTYFLMADAYVEEDGKSYVEDIVAGFDAAGELVYTFDTHDALGADPPAGPISDFWGAEFPSSTDAWHSNGIFVTPDRDVYLSMKRIDAVVKIADDHLEWVMTGDGLSPYLETDFTMVAAGGGNPSFKEQHQPALLPNGHLTVFDNHVPRGLELAVDEESGTATYVRDWPIEGPCLFEGSVYPTADDHWLLTCPNTHVFWEYGAEGTVVRTLEVTCPSGAEPPLTGRGVPLDLWAAHVGTVRATRQE